MGQRLEKALANVPFAHRSQTGVEQGDHGVHLELLEGMVTAQQILFWNPGNISLECFDGGWHMFQGKMNQVEEGGFFQVCSQG
jgi:hypothetical protein